MTEHKFTDEEVIKALELCFTQKGTTVTCAKCPYHPFGKMCKVMRDKDALDLINRKKAEIEELTVSNERLGKILTSYALQYGTVRDQSVVLETARAEAIKEFAERLKEMCDDPYYCVWMSEIDDLVEEMTEEKE